MFWFPGSELPNLRTAVGKLLDALGVTREAVVGEIAAMEPMAFGARARGLNQEPIPLIPQKILYMERRTGLPSQAGEDIRRHYRERVAARLKGPDELARVLLSQKEEGRQRALQRARERKRAPKKLSWAALTKEELARKRRDRYQLNKDALNQKRRHAYQRNPEPMRQKKREARALERKELSPEQRSVQRWLKWRARQRDLEPTLKKPERLPPTPAREDSLKRWLAFREARKRTPLAQPGAARVSRPRGLESESHIVDPDEKQKRLDHSMDYDFGP